MWQIETVAVRVACLSPPESCAFAAVKLDTFPRSPSYVNCTITLPVGTPRYLIHCYLLLSNHLHKTGNLSHTCCKHYSLELGGRVKDKVQLMAKEWEHQKIAW